MHFKMMLTWLLLVAAPVPVCALDTLQVKSPDTFLEEWRWTSFDNDLAGRVQAAIEDREGRIWVGTDRGVQYYDGYKWTKYTVKDGLADGDVRAILQARDGTMWFGTKKGISRFNGREWKTFGKEEGVPGPTSWDGFVQLQDGSIWASLFNKVDITDSQQGIVRFDGDRWVPVPLPWDRPRPPMANLIAAANGDIWASTLLDGIFRFDGEEWEHYGTETGLPSDRGGFLCQASNGAIWVPHWDVGISRFDGTSWQTFGKNMDGLKGMNEMMSAWEMPDGTIWSGGGLGAKGNALFRYDGEDWRAYGQGEAGRPWHQVRFGVAAKDGSVWMASVFQKSLQRFVSEGAWSSHTHPDGLHQGACGRWFDLAAHRGQSSSLHWWPMAGVWG
jgi:hypothetical protein